MLRDLAAEGGAGSLRSILAPNASPLTLEGTRTYLVGTARVAIIDPGPAHPSHLEAIAQAVGTGTVTAILLTHLHPDHAEGAPALAERLGAPVSALALGTLAEGDVVETDAGELVAVATPGHTPDHTAFHWPAARALFVGDLMLGGMDTALVAAPEGDLEHYLASLGRVRALEPAVLYPSHGVPFTDPLAALGAYMRHRCEREGEVLRALEEGADSAATVAAAVYGQELPEPLREMVSATAEAYLEHLSRLGRVRRAEGGRWALV
jgi:glyoxylase-like metal-dependent hydrolase (beta-lactamase superfamily II)